MGHGLIEHARELGVQLPSQRNDPAATPQRADILQVLRQIAGRYFPLLASDEAAIRETTNT